MTSEANQPEGSGTPRVSRLTGLYVGVVAAVGVSLTAAAINVYGIRIDATFWVVILLAVVAWWSGSVVVAGEVTLSFTSIVLLAAMALVGPAGAGIVGIFIGPLQEGRTTLAARLFNAGMISTMGVVGGAAYIAVGGAPGQDALGTWEVVHLIGIPVLVADVVQLFVNLALLAGVVRLSGGPRIRTQVAGLLSSSVPANLGYGIIAFILVVLWGPGGLGSASVFLILPPLVVAQWAYRQYSEELTGHERALGVLVAAVEAKAPHLVGHSGRVAELSESMAEHLGLRAQVVADVRVAGMLHDLGLTALPTGLVRSTWVVGGPGLGGYPARGADLLKGLSFLSGSLDGIAHHRDAVAVGGADAEQVEVAAQLVGLADEYDLLTQVGSPDGARLGRDEALAVLRHTPAGSEEHLAALEQAIGRRAEAPS